MIIKNFESILPEFIRNEMTDNHIFDVKLVLTFFAFMIVLILIMILLAVILMKCNKRIFRAIEKKRGRKIHIQFLEKLINFAIVVVVIIIPLAGESIGKTILGSATILAAIVGFAAQGVISDMISGLLISIYKPFDIGDRIELEDGTVGVVETITMRHVVIMRIDTLRVVIPNSKLNSLSVVNYSYDYVERSNVFRFAVGYESDIKKVKQIISEAVESSPYSQPGKKQKDGSSGYGPVYFIEIANSALIMTVTVYYKMTDATEVVKDDINTRVFEALVNAGIDVPYEYTNVVMKKDDQ